MVTARDWVFTGIPRSGTSICTRLLNLAPDTVALSEPMQLNEFAQCEKAPEAVEHIQRRFAEIRDRVVREQAAPSVQADGQHFEQRVQPPVKDQELRKPQGGVADMTVDKPLSESFQLVIKQNALFAALLPALIKQFSCLALIRNPLAVLASWQTVDLPVNRGSLPGGERYDAGLKAGLVAKTDALDRQVLILNWFFARYADELPRSRILKYEEIVSSGGVRLLEALGASTDATEPAAPLQDYAFSERYKGVDVEPLLDRLFKAGGAWQGFYSAADCQQLLAS